VLPYLKSHYSNFKVGVINHSNKILKLSSSQESPQTRGPPGSPNPPKTWCLHPYV